MLQHLRIDSTVCIVWAYNGSGGSTDIIGKLLGPKEFIVTLGMEEEECDRLDKSSKFSLFPASTAKCFEGMDSAGCIETSVAAVGRGGTAGGAGGPVNNFAMRVGGIGGGGRGVDCGAIGGGGGIGTVAVVTVLGGAVG
jgi:hypothetical protein